MKRRKLAFGKWMAGKWMAIWLCALALVIVAGHDVLFTLAIHAQEDAMDACFPSAGRYYAYGDRHFNAPAGSDVYDVQRAQYMYEHALALDPSLPYVYHQLARVAFIEGDLPKAYTLINIQVARHGDATPPSYYVRGLIEGYMGNYALAEDDYAHVLALSTDSWAIFNDYAWILLKENKFAQAHQVLARGLAIYPDSPWLLNSDSIALQEMGSSSQAEALAVRAFAQVSNVSDAQWLAAYPGNDPATAAQGLSSFRSAVASNMHTIQNE